MPILAPHAEPIRGYRLVRHLGSGGYGEVWEALAPGNVKVALKFLRPDKGKSDEELRILQSIKEIRHPRLLDIQFIDQVDDTIVIAMPLCDQSLAGRLAQCRQCGVPGIPTEELLRYLRECAEGVDFLNQEHWLADGRKVRVQHRDLKPQNIFLVGGSVRIADFGLANLCTHTVTSAPATMSLPYAAPESFNNQVAQTSDQYSLAVTYYQLRCGGLPFNGTAAQTVHGHLYGTPDLKGIPLWERDVVSRALSRNPAARWPSCCVFVEQLAAVAGRDSVASAASAGLPAAPEVPSVDFDVWSSSLLEPSGPLAGAVAAPAVWPPAATAAVEPVALSVYPTAVAQPRPRRRWPFFLVGLVLGLALGAGILSVLNVDWPTWSALLAAEGNPISEAPKGKANGRAKAPAEEIAEWEKKWEASKDEIDQLSAEMQSLKARPAMDQFEALDAKHKQAAKDLLKARADQTAVQAKLEIEVKEVAKLTNKLNSANKMIDRQKKLLDDLSEGRDSVQKKLEKAKEAGQEFYGIIEIDNKTKRKITYQIRWEDTLGVLTDWKESTLAPGKGRIHWNEGGILAWVKFDNLKEQRTASAPPSIIYNDNKNPPVDAGRLYQFEEDGAVVKLLRK
jgi:hypothetical protein